ncbi:Ubiquitin-conjugating enzyme E2 6 [Candidozyma auris]|uniref:Ubiquitin-conjugating enzyme E2 6 n=2 Tax=Candidozyma auris TaxID=498019 RepID=A0A2H0ZCC2_CANAR|nr:E2 ubiquitin-conjugating protein UBC6 [[Candida] auris]KNE01755.2 hypothetical protein QG37_01091 [[Candida] auris]PIS48288.1 hypothetical protein B9J08_004973 [[Candida] auris]PIS48900.1 hypothetical protein CJI97_005056 [[Candida] auris]PSK77059.1 hypothetical protein CJJ07_003101 [[Candida] auris]QEO22882.1 hypothetical_protein [[Candida] auris]
MVSRQAQKRLNKEYKSIQANPPPFIHAKPNEENILEWHYIITGPPSTPYEGGQYHGLLRFPPDYPFAPPAITVITPNGRFACNTRLCLSMSDYHPDTWNPAWSVATILTGLLSFMTGEDSTTGSIVTSEKVKRRLARDSKKWNNDNARFRSMFPDLVESNKAAIAEAERLQKKLEEKKASAVHANTKVDLGQLSPEDRARLQAYDSEVPRKGGYVALGSVLLAAIVAAYFWY